MSLNLKDPRIPLVQISRRFAPDDQIRRRQFELEDVLKEEFPEPPQVLNVPPDTPPMVPRLNFVKGHKSFVLTGNSAQMALDFSGRSIAEKTLQKYAGLMDEVCKKVLSDQDNFYNSVMVLVVRECEGSVLDVFKEMSKSFHVGSDVSMIELSKLTDDKVLSVNISGYTMFAAQNADPDFAQPSELGVQFRVEFNTKFYKGASPKGFSELAGDLVSFLRDGAAGMLGGLWSDVKGF